jgi:hypothetical protein
VYDCIILHAYIGNTTGMPHLKIKKKIVFDTAAEKETDSVQEQNRQVYIRYVNVFYTS